jgi:type I restriction enzyme S subunit
MGDEWQKGNLGDFVSLQRGHDLTESQRLPGKVPVMGSAGQNGFHDTSLAPGPGVVIGRSGASFGKVHYCTKDYWPHNTALYVTDFKGNDPRFAYYLLKTIDFSRYNSGSAQPSLNRNYIYSISVSVPEPIEQQAIAYILGALDDKIELNRRMNQTLEAMAQAIFKSWFVDFDPARAKAAGQQPPGLAPQIVDMSPDLFVDYELGEIPRGWEILTLRKVCELAYGKGLKASERKPGKVTVMGSNGQVGWHDEALVSGPGIIVGRKGNPGIVTWVHNDFYPIDTTFFVIPLKESMPLTYLYHALNQLDLHHLSADSAVPGLNRNIAYMSRILVPSPEMLRVFDRQAMAFAERTHQAEKQSCTLAAIRDVLLPKLISGQLRIPDAERIIGRHL